MQRQSNIELLRIFALLLIIAHHLVVHSGLLAPYGPIHTNPNSLLNNVLIVLGAYGKTGINCFVLISGYFYCKQSFTLEKYAKLFLEVLFYRVLIHIIFLSSDLEFFSALDYIKIVLPFSSIGTLFVDSFLAFVIFIPFLNKLVQNITKKEHAFLTIVLLFLFTVLGTIKIPGIRISIMNYVSWFIVLYFTSSYIRLYPIKFFQNTLFLLTTSITIFLLSTISVLYCFNNNWKDPYYFVADSNAIFAFLLGLSLFLLFNSIKIPFNRIINTFAAGAFGVLLIHDHSVTMQRWLWNDFLNIANQYNKPHVLLLYAIYICSIFVICSLLDQIRIHLIEKKLFKSFYHSQKIQQQSSLIK